MIYGMGPDKAWGGGGNKIWGPGIDLRIPLEIFLSEALTMGGDHC